MVTQHTSVYCIQLTQPLGVYLYSVLRSDESRDITDIIEMVGFIGELEVVRKDFIQAGGLIQLLSLYWKYHDVIDVEKFGVVLLGLLPCEINREE